jgi:hypothetical protein
MLRRLIPLVALAVAVACGSDSTTEPTTATLAGTWSLQSVYGNPLPVTLSQTSNDKLELLSDVVTASANGTYSESLQFRETLNGVATTSTSTDAGTFSLNGTAVTLSSNQLGNSFGALSDNNRTLTLTEQGFVWVFVKQ